MNQIRPWLYVGNYRDTLNRPMLRALHVGAMLLLAELVRHPGIVRLYLAVEDGIPLADNTLRQGADFVLEQKRLERTGLIACGAGQSRSVTFAVAALKEEEGLALLDAVQAVSRQHSEALPHMALWESLCRIYQEDISFLSMLKALDTMG